MSGQDCRRVVAERDLVAALGLLRDEAVGAEADADIIDPASRSEKKVPGLTATGEAGEETQLEQHDQEQVDWNGDQEEQEVAARAVHGEDLRLGLFFKGGKDFVAAK